MGFAGVYTALYDYQPQTENELEIAEGDLLYILDKSSDDGWWKAKKKTVEIDAEEPVGLVPNNYVEEAKPIQKAKSLYDYTRQTDEEVSFSEDAELLVFDTSDPDWTLVCVNNEYGFAPSNYIEITETLQTPDSTLETRPPLPERTQQAEPQPEPEPEPEPEKAPAPQSSSSPEGPAAAIAGILHQQRVSETSDNSKTVSASPSATHQPPVIYTPEDSDEVDNTPPPALPKRPVSQLLPGRESSSPPERSSRDHLSVPRDDIYEEPSSPGIQPSPPYSRVASDRGAPRSNSIVSTSGYHIYNISEMVSVMGKRKKMPTTLGINIATGKIFISPEKTEDGPYQEWTADRLTHYSIEGKHVFLDLVRPSKSVDFHAGAKDTAQEIVSALGEIAGGYRAEGLREVIAAGTSGSKKKGRVLYDFMAQGDDEVTVAVGDEVVILDDTKSEEWWMVRQIRNGQEGVVPSSYIEITGVVSRPEPSYSGANAGLSTVEQNRLEEQRLAKESARRSRRHESDDSRMGEHRKRDSKSSKPKPNPAKTRKWTDRTGAFTVIAEFIGLTDGKIHLHKQNGVKIAVPISKMSIEDLEYVEKVTGVSLDEDKPLSDIRRRSQANTVGASVKRPEYDWFDFFLRAGVGPNQCERYAQSFAKDSMDESVLPDITSENLRTLGLKEGDILRVMKYLDNQYRNGKSKRNVSFGGEEVIGNDGSGGLFSGPGGVLRNNTRKGRPAPAVQTSDIVDPKAFEPKDDSSKPASPGAKAKDEDVPKGFEDNAWEVKHPKQPATSAAPSSTSTSTATPAPAPAPATQAPTTQDSLAGAMADLSLLQEPLQPSKQSPPTQSAQSQPTISLPPPQPSQVSQAPQPQMTGASPAFFSQLGQPQGLTPQLTGLAQQQQPAMPPRQRPQPPPVTPQGSSLLPPPPQRPLSAPGQNPGQSSAFGPPPLQPQLTGVPQAGFQQTQLQPNPTGYIPQSQFGNQLLAQHTGMIPQQQQQQVPGFQNQQSFISGPQQPGLQTLAPQRTGYPAFSQPQTMPALTGNINSVLPPPLQPQPTGVNGFAGNASYTPSPPPVPPIPQQPTAQPLQPQKTGPPPPVRFGVRSDAKKLAPQPTGLRANLAQATPTNPFGF
ncbi:hypothetical protein VTO42DRAFT_5218 [Malbranchea cinnamomea]